MLAILLALALLGHPAAADAQCCSPAQSYQPTSFSFSIDYGGIGTSTQRNVLAGRINVATERWNKMFRSHSMSINASPTSSGGSVQVVFTTGILDGDEFFDGDHTVFLPAEWITNGGFSASTMIGDIQHEFGHVFGFAQANCAGSLMSDPDPNNPIVDFSPCDLSLFTSLWGPAKTDADNDDVFLEDGDCRDDQSSVWPGNGDAAGNCQFRAPSDPFYDQDCSGLSDYAECTGSPIVLDMDGDGIALSDRSSGVAFDLDGDGVAERLPWTRPHSDDGWLALDRNGNGRIDNGTELFGNFSDQEASPEPNGFLALAVFDQPAAGGNSNGRIDKGDAVFSELRIWVDRNHDGRSRLSELHTLASVGVESIALNYHQSRRVDQWGNMFRYRARVEGLRSRWAFDVFFPPEGPVLGETARETRDKRNKKK
jgi:hypothetical protein